MCFSATVSFGASAVLLATGGTTLRYAQPKQRLLAAVPLLFGIQQFSEGVQWLYLDQGQHSPVAAYFFLFFAYAVWPAYVPLAVSQMDRKRSSLFRLLTGLGIFVSLIFLVMHFSRPLTVEIVGNSISYGLAAPFGAPGTNMLNLAMEAAYLLVTIAPLALARDKYLRLMAFMIAGSAALAGFIYTQTYTSTWCFFAAVISVMVGVAVRKGQKAS